MADRPLRDIHPRNRYRLTFFGVTYGAAYVGLWVAAPFQSLIVTAIVVPIVILLALLSSSHLKVPGEALIGREARIPPDKSVEIHRRAGKLLREDPRNGPWFLSVLAGVMLTAILGALVFPLGMGGFIAGIIAIWISLCLAFYGFTFIRRQRYAPLVRRVARDHGYPVCVGCGHLHTASDTSQCAVCGATQRPVET